MRGKLQHLNWFTDWKAEYGYYFDPTKTRKSIGVLNLDISGSSEADFFGQTEFNLNDSGGKNFALAGWNKLRFSPFFKNFNPEFIKNENGSFVAVEDLKNFENENLSTAINTMSFLEDSNTVIEYEGVKKKNTKSFWNTILVTGLGVAGSLRGVRKIPSGFAGPGGSAILS